MLVIDMFIFQRAPTDEIPHDHSALTLLVLFKANHDHTVALRTATPAVMSIFFANFARRAELQITVCADVVVPVVADETVEAGC